MKKDKKDNKPVTPETEAAKAADIDDGVDRSRRNGRDEGARLVFSAKRIVAEPSRHRVPAHRQW